jgi:hypothetical protein
MGRKHEEWHGSGLRSCRPRFPCYQFKEGVCSSWKEKAVRRSNSAVKSFHGVHEIRGRGVVSPVA